MQIDTYSMRTLVKSLKTSKSNLYIIYGGTHMSKKKENTMFWRVVNSLGQRKRKEREIKLRRGTHGKLK